MSIPIIRRVALLYADETAQAAVPRIKAAVQSARDVVHVVVGRIGAAALAAHGVPLPGRALQAAASADAALVAIGEPHGTTAAAVVGLREELGFTRRFAENELARMWLSESGLRGCFTVGLLPAGLAAVALALEYVLGDPEAADALRDANRLDHLTPRGPRVSLSAVEG
jgi:hypothetical protein